MSLNKMASNSDNNLLIDLDASSTGTYSTNSSPKMPDESLAAVTDSVSLFRTSMPLYKLLGSHAMASYDSADNNPFDCMVKQARLLDDPFEIVENAAKAATTNNERQHVETGTLISLDSLDASSPLFQPKPNEIIEISSSSSDNSHQESISAKQTQNSVQNVNDNQTPPSATTQNAFASMAHNMSTPLSRCMAKTKSSALHLLKFSLSKSRMDSTSDNGSPILADPDSSSGDDYATILNQKMKNSKTLMLHAPAADESFDDLSATKPNWIDSETDLEIDSDLDNDIAKLNIPMLTTKLPSESDDLVAIDTPAQAADTEKIENDAKMKEHDAVVNRDKLLEKFASIKLNHPSPRVGEDVNDDSVKETCTDSIPLIQVDDENGTPKNDGVRSAISASLKAQQPENTNSLIEHLKKIVDQCDDKQKQSEAKSLLENLSTILSHGGEKTQASSEQSSSSFEQTPPQPIIRQGTFNIDRGDDVKVKRTTDTKHDADCTPKTSHEPKPKSKSKSKKSPNEASSMNPALSQVLKDLQNVLGPNQCVNVVQTNMQQQQQIDGVNPTYIVVMGASSNDTMDIGTPQMNRRRSQSFSSRDRPVAAVRASQVTSEQQRQQQTPMRRPTLTRGNSFGSITRPKPVEQLAPPPKMATTILRRRSFQGALPSTNLRPPSPKSTISAKSTVPSTTILRRRSFQEPSPSSNVRPPSPKSTISAKPVMSSDAVPAKRRSLLSSTAIAPKDSPSKMKSSYGIIKKPQAPPLVRNLKIRVKESFAGRSSAPMRAVVPMNRVAPLVMINESVSPVDDKRRKGPISSTPRPGAMPPAMGTNISINGK